MKALVDVIVDVGGGFLTEVEIREELGFVEGAFVRANERFSVWSDSCDRLCASSRYFISITSASMMSVTNSGGMSCPLRRRRSCCALIKTE